MLWHRRPGLPARHLTTPIKPVDKSPFWYCVQNTGYREKVTNFCLCLKCFKQIRTLIIRAQYEFEASHFALNSLTYHEVNCSQCLKSVTEIKPIRNCFTCTNRLWQYLHEIDISEQIIDHMNETTYVISRGSFY